VNCTTGDSWAGGKAALKRPHSKRWRAASEVSASAKRLECADKTPLWLHGSQRETRWDLHTWVRLSPCSQSGNVFPHSKKLRACRGFMECGRFSAAFSSVFTMVLFLSTLLTAHAYDFIATRPLKWRDGSIPMNLQLDATMTPVLLSDGKFSWDAVAQEALGLWNGHLTRVQFTTFTAPGRGDGNDVNEVFFSSHVYGQSFGSFVLAITTTWRLGRERVEADTIFNEAIDWDSYRGDERLQFDLRRVAIHEFGHTLGLDHPDEARQIEIAIMNSTVSDLDTLAPDDIRGARALYPSEAKYQLDIRVEPPDSGTVIAYPPPGANGYPAGTMVKLTAKPARRHRFAAWSGDENRTGRVLKWRAVDNETIVANFSTNGAPVVKQPPEGGHASFGDSVSFQVTAVSGTPMKYQWQFNGSDLAGATSPELFLNFVTHANSGLYSCRITNARGATISKAARLVVDGY